VDPASADAVEGFLARLRALCEGRGFPFTLVLDDPSGNSFLENPLAPRHDPRLRVHYYTRTEAASHALGCLRRVRGRGHERRGGPRGGRAGAQRVARWAPSPRRGRGGRRGRGAKGTTTTTTAG